MDAPGDDAMVAQPDRDERPVGGLLADLARQFALLLRQELALARAEMVGKVGRLGGGAGLLAAGGLLAFAGLLYLLAAATLALTQVVDPWLAALAVGAVALVLGLVLVLVGRSRFRGDRLIPQRTIRSLKDDAAWAREQAK